MDSVELDCVHFDLFYLEVLLTCETSIPSCHGVGVIWLRITVCVLIRVVCDVKIVSATKSGTVGTVIADSTPLNLGAWILLVVVH